MNRGLFSTQRNICWDIIRSLELDRERIWYPMYEKYKPSNFRSITYLKVWETCLTNQIYDFQLIDNSLIQFRVDSFNPPKVGYSYYECPYQCLSYKEFIETEMGFDIMIVGDGLMEEYGDYLSGCTLKDTVTPIRYDYDPDRYEEGKHPASHVHFGHQSNIRVGTRKLLVKPLSFLLFTIRQMYPNHWAILLQDNQAPIWCRNVRTNLANVHTDYWKPKDLFELVLQ